MLRQLVTYLSIPILTSLTACEITRTASDEDEAVSGATVYELFIAQKNQDNAFNIVFVPDTSYGDMSLTANRQAFIDDMTNVIENAFWQNRAYFNGLFYFNYYYMAATGSVIEHPDSTPEVFKCPVVTWPDEADTDGAFADMLVLMHTNELRDCGGGGRATSEPTSFRTVIHESGHAIFGLPDEYEYGAGWNQGIVPPVTYSSEANCESDPDNASWRDCREIGSSGAWRSQGNITSNLIMLNAGAEVWESGPADWELMRRAYLTLPTAPNIAAPEDFAPASWSYDVPPPLDL